MNILIKDGNLNLPLMAEMSNKKNFIDKIKLNTIITVFVQFPGQRNFCSGFFLRDYFPKD